MGRIAAPRLGAAIAVAIGIQAAAVMAGAMAAASAADRGQVVERSVHGAWSLACAAQQKQRCSLSQVVATDPAGKNVVLGVAVDLFDSATVPTIHFRLSANALREAGLGMKIDETATLRLPIGDCDKQYCQANGRIDDQLMALMRAGKVIQVAFLTAQRKQVTVPVSLSGFDAAIDALREASR